MTKSIGHLAIFAFIFALSVTGVAQLPGGSPGPDVIVGALHATANYSHNNATGIDAFSIGTTSCNLGTQNLLWIASNNQHPVISQNAYRVHDGRFEQIGQSWLKHAFTAINNGICGSCNGNLGSVLGVGCSDPYGAGLNGSQGGLGPKFEINAYSGFYPYPFTNGNQGSTGTSTYKRLQIHMTDLDPVANNGATYFVESQYVTADDALTGNGFNNASHRRVVFNPNGGGFNIAFGPGSSTVQMQPAIFGWKDIVPSVSLKPVDVPGEGRFFVGVNVTELPNGDFAWDVSVHNLNSHRSARSITVDLPTGAAVSNASFHDVDYHSGEPYPTTDWTSSVANDQITWQTDTFATNSNANALRWGTTYSFHFETNSGPDAGPFGINLGLFRPGMPANVSETFDPPNFLTLTSGDNQAGNINEAFGDPLVVRVTQPDGTPLAGTNVDFAVTNGQATLSDTTVATDANGFASVTATAGLGGGAILVEASTESGGVTFNLFARRFNLTWVPGAGILVFSVSTEVAGMPLVLAADNDPQPIVSTIFGDFYTSVPNPGPGLTVTSAFPGFGTFDPTLITNTNGSWSKIIQGAQALNGIGLDVVFQVYGYYFDNMGDGQFYISNPRFQTF